MKALWDNSIHDKEYDVRRHMAKQTTQQDYVLERNARARHDDRAKNGVQAMLIFTWERKSFNLSCL